VVVFKCNLFLLCYNYNPLNIVAPFIVIANSYIMKMHIVSPHKPWASGGYFIWQFWSNFYRGILF